MINLINISYDNEPIHRERPNKSINADVKNTPVISNVMHKKIRKEPLKNHLH